MDARLRQGLAEPGQASRRRHHDHHRTHGGVYEQQRDEPQALTTQAPALAIDAPDLRMLWTVPGGNVVQEAQTAAG